MAGPDRVPRFGWNRVLDLLQLERQSTPATFCGDRSGELQATLYRQICFLVGAITLVVIVPFNSLLHLPPIVNLAAALFGAGNLVLYWLSRRGRYYPGIFVVFTLAALALVWFPNSGSNGSIAYYLFVTLLYPVFLLNGWKRWAGIGVTMLAGVGLILADYLFPELPTPFKTASDRTLDLLTGYLFAGGVGVSALWVIVSGYRRERDGLAESRAVLSAVMNSTDDLVFLVDPVSHRLLLFNRAFEETMGESGVVGVCVGASPDELLPPHAAVEWRGFYRKAVEAPFTIEYPVPGTNRVVLHSLSPVVHEGRLLGISVFGKDITEVKKAEEERDRMELRLRESQKMESLGSLAGGVAHDFNNMLAGIMGYADLLLTQETEPDRRVALQAIVQAASRSSDLTRKMLAFARRGKNIVEAVNVTALSLEAMEMLRPTFHPNIRLVVEGEATKTVDADPSQMNQVIVNLCMNANDAMPNGGVLTVRTAEVVIGESEARALEIEPGVYVSLEVSDTGHGMSDEVQAHIFEPFFTTKAQRNQPGTGLGLSTVYGIVHLYNGTITVDSTPDAGSCFRVLLPAGQLVATGEPKRRSVEPGTGLVLVVDDEPILRDFAVRALGRLGYAAVTAAEGDEALRVFAERHGELKGVLLDLKMPGKSGAEVFMAMRLVNPHVPVLICTGYGDNEEAQTLISLGARALLPKPFRIADLSERMGMLGN